MVANATATSCACASETIQTQLFVPLVVCFFVFATALLMGGVLLAVQCCIWRKQRAAEFDRYLEAADFVAKTGVEPQQGQQGYKDRRASFAGGVINGITHAMTKTRGKTKTGSFTRFRRKSTVKAPSTIAGSVTAENNDWAISFKEIKMGSRIGSGNVGSVSRAVWRGTIVAVKRLLRTAEDNDDEAERFQSEIRLMMQMHHPNVLMFIGVVTEPAMCLVTEYCENGDLETYIHDPRKNMSWKMRFSMMVDIARGMHYVHHRAGIIQRDLKCANLLLDEHLNIKIADFGLSRNLAPGSMDTYCGTPATMAPEIVLQKPYTEKSDVFSFAIIVTELLTRDRPYFDSYKTGMALAYAVATEHLRPTLPSYVPTELATLIGLCWSTDEQKRPGFESVLETLQKLRRSMREAIVHKRAERGEAIATLQGSGYILDFDPAELASDYQDNAEREDGEGGGETKRRERTWSDEINGVELDGTETPVVYASSGAADNARRSSLTRRHSAADLAVGISAEQEKILQNMVPGADSVDFSDAAVQGNSAATNRNSDSDANPSRQSQPMMQYKLPDSEVAVAQSEVVSSEV